MAENRLETRILLRYATYSQWMNSSVILLPGEVAIAAFTRLSTINNTDDIPDHTPPAIGMKVGDGYSTFDELPWVQGIAADVYSWAKASTPPAASTIPGLAEFVAAQIAESGGGGGGEGGNAAAAYRIIYDNATSKYILQYYDETTDDWVNTSSEINLSSILNRITTIERWANGARSNLGNIDIPIAEYIYEEVLNFVNALDYSDQIVPHQFVTSVVETNGVIAVTRSTISASDLSGVLSTEQGGTGITRVEDDELLVGSVDGSLQVRRFVNTIESDDRTSFVTAGAVIDYVLNQTAGLTGAMHFIGEATVTITESNSYVDPQIQGYDFHNVQAGDVILANNHQEFVWNGDSWRLLGDEGSYAVKGSIVNVDIADEANISQSKIEGLTEALAGKVDKVDGYSLISTEEKNKLRNIEDNAQENVIEHIFVNDVETLPTTFDGQDKSVNLQIPVLTAENIEKLNSITSGAQPNTIEHIYVNGTEVLPRTINEVPKVVNVEFVPYTTEEQEKLSYIEPEAQVNTIESITINGVEYTPDQNKNIEISIDQAALNLNVLEGARVPGLAGGTYEDVDITTGHKKLELARIAKTGNVKDLLQTNDTYITLYCGTSTEVI